ncbi:neuromedin-U receptor 1 [Polypterus senegalus]|uniref:neuromedin-U receptor 1 n=1 Tax=Polypterus senegalus TaxID=55291 RepID=UPI00196401C7|nr:neuromedin-U receptor 1 [Polypterus senegalus]
MASFGVMANLQVNCSMQQPMCEGDLQNQSRHQIVDPHLSLEELLFKYLGPRRSAAFLPVCITYLLIFLVGTLGNSLTCVVIIRHNVMQTPTNFYLFSLAVSDLLVLLLGMPLELYEMWHNYPFLFGTGGCYFKTFLFETVCFASILNVTALSVERYIAVVHPIKAKFVVTRTHAKRVIIILWTLSVVCAIPNTSLHGIFYLVNGSGHTIQESAMCILVKPRWLYNLTIQLTTLLFFFLPMVTISILYLLIGLQLKRERVLEGLEAKAGTGRYNNESGRIKQHNNRRRQVTKMLFVLVVVFGVCWAPFHTDRLMWSFIDQWTGEWHLIFQYVHIISGVFFYLSSVVNPILYNLMSSRFREMFKEVMCHQWRPRSTRTFSLSITRVTMRSTTGDTLPNLSTGPFEAGDSEFCIEGHNQTSCT